MLPGDKIVGSRTEDSVPGEGKIVYDIKFYIYTTNEERIKLIINLEAQKKFQMGYDLVTRGIFYGARRLSGQLDIEFMNSDFDNIKKVYSIWICMDTPKYAINTITEYSMEQKKVVGNFQGKARYDLISVIMLCLGKYEETESNIFDLLGTLLSDKQPLEKKTILENKYHIPMTTELKEGINIMCNLSELVEERGIEKGANRLGKLIAVLLEAGLEEEALKVSTDVAEREKMYQKYHIG